jgi:ferric-dicitrate binding protein FerR (iron transport regulator)
MNMDDQHLPPNPDGRIDPEEPVARLLGLAGRRPRLPESEVTPVREAVREVWRHQLRVAARRRKWTMGIAAALTATVVAALLGPIRRPPPEVVGFLEVVVGTLALDGAAISTAPREPLLAHTRISTGPTGRAAVRLATGGSLRLDQDSAVRLDTPTALTLERGALYLDTGPRGGPGGAVEVRTALGTIRDVGTQFEARLLIAGGLQIRVREGAVQIAQGSAVAEAHAGGMLLVPAAGPVHRGQVPTHGAAWEWVQTAAPPFQLEGARLRDFLDWTARETGLRWRFTDPHQAGAATATILHGSAEGLTVFEALSVVLPGAGLRYRLDHGELILDATGGAADSAP